MEINPDIAYPFLVLAYQVFMSMHLVAKMKKSKKAIASALVILDARSGTHHDPYFTTMSQYFIMTDNVYAELLRMALPFSEQLLKTILLLKPKLESITFASAASLRSNIFLDVIDNSATDFAHFQAQTIPMHYYGQTSFLSSCILTLLLSRPPMLLSDPHLGQFCKLVDTNGTFTHIATFDTFHPQADFEGTMKVSGKFSKLKNLMSENSTKQKHLHLQFHDDRRRFLIDRLSYLSLICHDQPPLIAANVVTLLTLLEMGRDEVVWHVMHPEDDRKSAQKAFTKSLEVLLLINWITTIKAWMLKYKSQVSLFFLNRMKVEWAQPFEQAVLALLAVPDLPASIGSVLYDIQMVFSELSDANLAVLQRFRLNWARLQVYFSLPDAVIPIKSMPHVTSTFNALSVMSMYVDRYETFVEQATDLSLLWNYKDVWYGMVIDAITKADGIPSLRCVPKLLASFSSLQVHLHEENMVVLITEMLDHFFTQLAHVLVTFALEGVQKKIEIDRAQFASFEGLFSESLIQEKIKDAEIYNSRKLSLQELNSLRYHIFECLAIFQEYPCIESAQFSFYPLQCLEAQLSISIQSFLQQFIYDHEAMNSKDAPMLDDSSYVVLKPSQIIRDLQTLLDECLRMGWGLPEFSFLSVLENVLTQQNDIKNISNFPDNVPDIIFSRTSPTKKKAVKSSHKPPYTVALSGYYVDVLTHRTVFNKFISSPHMLTFRSDCDYYELSALMTLLGPNGVQYLDAKLLKNISALGQFAINQCQHYLSLFSSLPDSTTSFVTYLAKFKNIDDIFQKTSSFGILCDIRKFYFKLFRRTFRFKSILNLISACQVLSTIKAPKTMEDDNFVNKLNMKSNSLSINDNIDNSLIQFSDFIRVLQPSQETYTSLTAYFALLLCFVSTREHFKYIPYADAHVKNAHGIATAIHILLSKSMSKFSECSKKQCQVLEETTFAHASTWLLQHLAHRGTSSKENNAQFLDSAFMILSKLGALSGKTGLEWMEMYIGVGLLQAMHSKVLRTRFMQHQSSSNELEAGKTSATGME